MEKQADFTFEKNSDNSASGNLASKAGVAYTYSTTQKHAVTALSSSNAYQYDSNGNMTQRTVSGLSYNFGYDAAGNRTQAVETRSAIAPPGGAVRPEVTVIDYEYDPLRRLVGAVYSSGESFGYEYDWAGNVLTYTQDLVGLPVVTTYTYQGDQLATAKASNSPTTWNYAFDVEGRLVEVTPGGSPGNGARRYSYSAAGYLVEVESHDGTGYLPQAEMVYNGLGQRLEMTAYAGGLSLTTQYVLDSEGGAAPLIATANSESTYYLYGLGAAAERAAGWSYYLHDGLGSLRKVVDADAGVTLERSYTPWGDVLSQSGSINPAQGYLGGWVDAATGLIYVGNGQYYDPQTGRFLTRDAQPGKFNPYVPGADPTGLLIGPMTLLVLARGRKGRKGDSKADFLIIAMVVLLAGGITLTSCNLPGGGEVDPSDIPPGATWTLTPTSTSTTTPTQTESPTVTPTQTVTCTPTLPPGAKLVYLTFDDGPGWGDIEEENTSALLDVLQAEMVKATFFVLGKGVKDYPETFRKIFQQGHTVGSHSFDHPYFTTLSENQVKDQIEKTERVIQDVLKSSSSSVQYFRYPYGDHNSNTDSWIKIFRPNYQIVSWDVDSLDYNYAPADSVKLADDAERLIRLSPKQNPIVLFHSTKTATRYAVPMIIRRLKPDGYQFAALP